MRRQVIISVILVAALLAGGAAVATYLVRAKAHPPTNPTQPPALLVRGLKLVPQTVVEPIIGYGTAQADRQARIAAQVAGQLVQLSPSLRVGELVQHGQLLIRIDQREYQRQLDRAASLLAADQAQLARLEVEQQNTDRLIEIANTELEIAQREYQRVLGLFEAGQAPPRELDHARQALQKTTREIQTLQNHKALFPKQRAVLSANRDLRQAELAIAQLNLERCQVHAPFAGRLQAVHVDIGERVNPGSPLFTLLDPDLIEVPIHLPVSIRDRLTIAANCQLTLDSNPTAAWSARVARIAPSAAENTRTFPIFLEVDNTTQQQPLIPGLFLHARIDGPTWKNALVIPRAIIQQQPAPEPQSQREAPASAPQSSIVNRQSSISHNHYVFIYQNGLAQRSPVNIQRHLFDHTIVTGPSPGDTVIITNLDALYHGAPVRIQNVPAGPRTGTDSHLPPHTPTTSQPPPTVNRQSPIPNPQPASP